MKNYSFKSFCGVRIGELNENNDFSVLPFREWQKNILRLLFKGGITYLLDVTVQQWGESKSITFKIPIEEIPHEFEISQEEGGPSLKVEIAVPGILPYEQKSFFSTLKIPSTATPEVLKWAVYSLATEWLEKLLSRVKPDKNNRPCNCGCGAGVMETHPHSPECG